MKNILFSIVLGIFFIGHLSSAASSCGVYTSQGVSGEYCISNSTKEKKKNVIVYFHGLGGNAQGWGQEGFSALLEKTWKDEGKKSPVVISISFGPVWFLKDFSTDGKVALHPFLIKDMIPALISKIGGLHGGKKFLVGQSMGGFNASLVLVKSPRAFSKIALMCPAIFTITPFSTPEELQAYIVRTNASPDFVKKALGIAQKEFTTKELWARHNTLSLATTTLNWNSPKLYISTGLSDEYGVQEGSLKLYEVATSNGVNAQWHPLPGHHCSANVLELAHFLVP